METYSDEDMEFSDYGRWYGPRFVMFWMLLLFGCAVFDGMALCFFLKVIHHLR